MNEFDDVEGSNSQMAVQTTQLRSLPPSVLRSYPLPRSSITSFLPSFLPSLQNIYSQYSSLLLIFWQGDFTQTFLTDS